MITNPPPKTYLSEVEVSALLGVPQRTEQTWRLQRRVLPFVRVGRLIRYRLADIEAYLASRTVSVDAPPKPPELKTP
jgi:excisionase family DNA binding protein